MSYRKRTRDQHFFDDGPKRILSLDGGGLRGSHTLGILKEMEALLRRRHGDDPEFRLAHYFDLIAGTSTGAIIAATLARGMTVDEVYRYYRDMGREVFRTTLLGGLSFGLVRSKYDKEVLKSHLQSAVGPETRLGDESIQTGLLILSKRIDTHSLWAMGNNPEGSYFEAPDVEPGRKKWVPNKLYPLWKLLRASAAAPTYFDPVLVEIGDFDGHFIDGGMSPFNDPSVQALMYATLRGYRVQWPIGADNLLMVSIGTGSFDPPAGSAKTGAMNGLKRILLRLVEPGATVKDAFFSVMHDNQKLTQTLMQWISSSPTATEIDSEIGALAGDLLGGDALLSFVRLDTELTSDGLAPLMPYLADTVRGRQIDCESLTKMDEPNNVELLWEVGRAAGRHAMQEEHFHPRFDLEPGGARTVLRVGIVGHRNNVLHGEDIAALSDSVADILERISRLVPNLTVVSALAEGADRIGARAALAAGYPIICPLPFDRDEYEKDFIGEESRREYRELLAAAADVRELSGVRADSKSAYEAVGAAVLRRSDLLVAIWDGEDARGRGGTAEVVQAAAARMPVVWVHSDPAVARRLVAQDQDDRLVMVPDARLEAEVAVLLSR